MSINKPLMGFVIQLRDCPSEQSRFLADCARLYCCDGIVSEAVQAVSDRRLTVFGPCLNFAAHHDP
jgi:hypothetical protein